MKKYVLASFAAASLAFVSCDSSSKSAEQPATNAPADYSADFNYKAEQFADLQILRYQVPGFNALTVEQKKLLYYLSQAALCGRDMMWDQNYKYNLVVRRTIEAIYTTYAGDKNSEGFKKFEIYAKQVWFSNGIHHHYSNAKILPTFSKADFSELLSKSTGLPMDGTAATDVASFEKFITPIVFDPKIAPKKVDKSPNKDIIASSAVNFYEGVTQKEVEAFYAEKAASAPDKSRSVEYGLNSKLMKEGGRTTEYQVVDLPSGKSKTMQKADGGRIVEKVWKVGGMYSPAIEKIVFWLEKAKGVAENDRQRTVIENLIKFYQTGDLQTWVNYNIAWVGDTASRTDFVNGFIEVYNDPLGYRGSFESVVNMKDMEASKRIAAIAKSAQFFEDNAPILPQHKKKNVKGITAKVITVVMESGDAAPSTPIGINLPNNNWIRTLHGSKSVNLGNLVEAYDQAAKGGGMLKEFYLPEAAGLVEKHGGLAGKLHTDMHEVIGHASGQLEEGVSNGPETLKNYYNTLEEGRADLVALYYILDKKLVDIGVMPSLEVGKAEYQSYITNGMMAQLTRLKPGEDIEEAHMRNRQMVAKWAYEKGKKDNVVEMKKIEGKTYFIVNDYDKLRTIFGELLREIQRIKSQGDFNAGRDLVEGYGVKVDKVLHKEVLERYAKLNLAPYKGFIQPHLKPIYKNNDEKTGEIIDVHVEYPSNFAEQMLWLGKEYSFLPNLN